MLIAEESARREFAHLAHEAAGSQSPRCYRIESASVCSLSYRLADHLPLRSSCSLLALGSSAAEARTSPSVLQETCRRGSILKDEVDLDDETAVISTPDLANDSPQSHRLRARKYLILQRHALEGRIELLNAEHAEALAEMKVCSPLLSRHFTQTLFP